MGIMAWSVRSRRPARSGSRSRRQACTHNRGTASPPLKLLPVHPPQQLTH
jgi:hypothetical protein